MNGVFLNKIDINWSKTMYMIFENRKKLYLEKSVH